MEVMILVITETPFEGAEKWERLQLPGLVLECIVCLAGQVSHFTTIDAQTYWRGFECNAIFLDHTHCRHA